ncbi:unnamed protein product [Zymoseptoria tritici ST99CH_1A5]|uniref:Uncharacterized protein n=1 Tax=Zymoseptoria tritici ST99CH_1A5 TaxID=1276529 RepID=A0A1Y6LTA1_ZYMTR|nr:unnamed protein product [Zymoseptoria tritici ST99CH_1A5]
MARNGPKTWLELVHTAHVFMKPFKAKPNPLTGFADLLSASIDCRVDFLPRPLFLTPEGSDVAFGGATIAAEADSDGRAATLGATVLLLGDDFERLPGTDFAISTAVEV